MLNKSLPSKYTIRKGRSTKANINDIMLATIIKPMLNKTKKHQSRVAEMLAMQMMKTICESHFWKISSSMTQKYATTDVSEIKPRSENFSVT